MGNHEERHDITVGFSFPSRYRYNTQDAGALRTRCAAYQICYKTNSRFQNAAESICDDTLSKSSF